MTKDEMKNRISFALKDPILQQGFECICKNLAELEKENADLREELTETKKLLARWIDDRPYTVSEQKDLIADTEQFLKEWE